MKGAKLFWKLPLVLTGVVIGVVLLLLIAVVSVLYVPSLRRVAIEKGVVVAAQKTGMDIDLDSLYLSPFHHSPMVLYRAWKGQGDLPLEVRIDSLFVGHRGQDTLVYVRHLRLKATVHTISSAPHQPKDLLSLPIEVEHLLLDKTTFHSGPLIATVGVDVVLRLLETSSPALSIAEGRYPLHGLRIYDTFVGIDLRPSPKPAKPKTGKKNPLRLAFDVPDGDLRNIHFLLTPLGLDIRTRTLQPDVLVDVGGNTYDAHRLEVGGYRMTIGKFYLPLDTVHGDACVALDKHLITSNGLHARSDEIGAQIDLTAAAMNLEEMRVDVDGDAQYKGSKAQLKGYYDINDEAYDVHAEVERVDLTALMRDSTYVLIAGELNAKGQGINPRSRAMRSKVQLHLTDACYGTIDASGLSINAELAQSTVDGDIHLPIRLRDAHDRQLVSAQTDHTLRVSDFMTPSRMCVNYRSHMRDIQAHVGNEDLHAQQLDIHFTTDSSTSLNLATENLKADLATPMHVLQFVNGLSPLLQAVKDSARIHAITSLRDLTQLDSLRRLIPALNGRIDLSHGSPVQPFIDRTGLDIRQVGLELASDSLQTAMTLDLSIPQIEHPEDSIALRLPAANAALKIGMTEGNTSASLTANSQLTDGAMSLHGLQTDADLWFDVQRNENKLNGVGCLTLDNLSYDSIELGSRAVDLALSPSALYPNALRAEVRPDDIPMEIVNGILKMADLNLSGALGAQASIDGLPKRFDLSAEVLPKKVSALYRPYDVRLSLGETPVVMQHNKIDFNGLPVYAVDSTYLALTGGLDLNNMRLDVNLAADSLVPVRLEKGGPIPVYGGLATDIRGSVTGPLDSILADVDITILPCTDITYPIDKKNLAQVKPHGTVNVRYGTAEGGLSLGGEVRVDDGFIRYSPKAYPIMPFHVDSGSHVAFNGPVGQTLLDISASQKVKADVESEGEETRRVDFTTGVRVNGVVDSIGLHSIDFFLEAPNDETVTRELASVDEETREGLAATLLATGMYVGESNVAAQRGGYALSSIVSSRLNAAMSNSKMGKVVDIDLSSAQTEHAGGKTNDLNIAISKSFFKDRLRITLGSTLTDNPEVNQTSGWLNALSAEYKLTKDGNVLLRIFEQRDYNNILEGELYKSGVGVRAMKEWKRQQLYRGDTITRTYDLTGDVDVAWRSNNSLGPNLTLKSSIKNLMGKGETFTIKGSGAYYWALRNRHPGDPRKTDTYKLGVNASLIFPYLHWAGDNNPEGNTRYMLNYQYENIAGGYGVHKVAGSFSYFIQSTEFITHIFTPLSLSVVLMKAESDNLLNKAEEYPQLIKLIAGNEFVPSIGYTFLYNDYRSKRPVNTMIELGVKESANLLNAMYCLFGRKWNEKDKPFGNVTFNQFIKLTAELRNRFNITDQVCIATRLYAGANIPLGNSSASPLSEAFYMGGPNSMRAAAPYAYGAGNFYSDKYNQNFFHSGDLKLEANFELRFPIVWKLFGAAFVDAGNVWNWYNSDDVFKKAGFPDYQERLQLHEELYDGIINNPHLAKQIALGTGAGLRLDLDGLVIRLDLGVAIHAPYQTYRYNKDGTPDRSRPINTYFNIPSALDALRLNFGIGYPF